MSQSIHLLERNLKSYHKMLIESIVDNIQRLKHDPNSEQLYNLWYYKLSLPELNDFEKKRPDEVKRWRSILENRINSFQKVMTNILKTLKDKGEEDQSITFLDWVISSVLAKDEKEGKLPNEVIYMLKDSLRRLSKGQLPNWAFPSKIGFNEKKRS